MSFIDPFNNLIIIFKVLCLKRVNLFDTCADVTPFRLLIFTSDNPLLKPDYRISLNTLYEKKCLQIFDFAGKIDIKAGERAMQ